MLSHLPTLFINILETHSVHCPVLELTARQYELDGLLPFIQLTTWSDPAAFPKETTIKPG